MTYAPLTNWKYDKNLYHRIQSGPQKTGSDLNLTDTYELTSSGYRYTINGSGDYQQTFVSLSDEGFDFGTIVPGPPNVSGYFSTEWRSVPPAVSGYWNDYNESYPHVSGLLNIYNGFRRQGLISTANSTVQTAFGPEPGLKDIGAYTWYGAAVPDNQFYDPFETPQGNTSTQGITGGPNSYPRARFPTITNPTQDTSGSRAAWEYHQPVYCQTFVESVRSDSPGGTGPVVRNMYRGRSSRYVPNYGGVYGVLGEGVRGMIRTYSPGTNL